MSTLERTTESQPMPNLKPRPVHDGTREAMLMAQSRLTPASPCAVAGCTRNADHKGRFCPAHGRYRARHGAADQADVLSSSLLVSATKHLLQDRDLVSELLLPTKRDDFIDLVAGPEVRPGDLLTSADPSPEEFMAAAKDLSFDSQASLLWRHLHQERLISRPEVTLMACVASRWVYLLLDNAGLLGTSQRGGWTPQDHTVAYRTVFGRWLTRDQKLTTYRLPAGVARRFAPDLEKHVLPKRTFAPQDDAEFLARLKPNAQRDQFALRLFDSIRNKHESSIDD